MLTPRPLPNPTNPPPNTPPISRLHLACISPHISPTSSPRLNPTSPQGRTIIFVETTVWAELVGELGLGLPRKRARQG